MSDGSTVYLDTGTEIAVNLSGKTRHISLKRGRASFSVFHEPERPFVVVAGNVRVRALGTEFGVDKVKKGKISVEVTKGRVQVIRKNANMVLDDPDGTEVLNSPVRTDRSDENVIANQADSTRHPPEVILSSGQKIIVDEQKAEYEIKAIDAKQVNVWQKGRLFFDKRPLVDVIDEINRYLEQKIIIGEEGIKDVPVSMIFNVRDHKFFLLTLERAIPLLASEQASNGRIILIRKEMQ